MSADSRCQMDASRTPTAGHKRGREHQPAPSPSNSPLAALLEQIRRLKLPSVDSSTANRLLGPFVREALKFDERGTLLAIVQQFGWEDTPAGGSSSAAGFTRALDLGSFSLLLQVRMLFTISKLDRAEDAWHGWEGSRGKSSLFWLNPLPKVGFQGHSSTVYL